MIAREFNYCFLLGNVLPRMDINNTILSQKGPNKANAIGSYKPNASLNMLWWLLTTPASDKRYQHVEQQYFLPEEGNGAGRDLRLQKICFRLTNLQQGVVISW